MACAPMARGCRKQGHRFDVSKLLLDPYATRVDGAFTHHADLTRRGAETAQLVPKCIVEAQSDRRNCPAAVAAGLHL